MATGDVKNNLRKLIVELKHINYPITEVDLKGLSQGAPRCFLPILHYLFLDFSIDLTEFFAKDYELYGKTDLRFLETVYKILRDVFQYKPPLTREQFLAIGFAERKIIQVCEIVKKCREKYSQLNPRSTKAERRHSNSKVKAKTTVNLKQDVTAWQGTSSLRKMNQKDTRQQIQTDSKPYSKVIENKAKSILKTRKDKDKENRNCLSYSDVVNERMGKRNEVEEMEKQCSRLRNGIKNVRWEEKEQTSHAVTIPMSVLGSANHNGNIIGTLNSTIPTPQITKAVIPLPPRVIPAPVSMTTAPEPSPDLMLTPVTKTGHQAIPLSGCHHENREDMGNVSLVDLTDSTVISQPRIVRHQYGGPQSHPVNQTNLVSQDSELKSLKTIVEELQEKLDSVLAQNNEMSARIVLLENKVKLMEEAHNKNVCDTCTNRNHSLSNSTLSNCVERVKPHAPASTAEYFPKRTAENIVVSSYPCDSLVKSYSSVPQSTSSSRRYLFNDFNGSLTGSGQHSTQAFPQGLSNDVSQQTVIEISDDDDFNSTSIYQMKITSETSPGTSHQGHKTLEVISPFQTTSDVHLTFADSSTTATIMNVERRLKETRALLASATRFTGSTVP